LHVGRISTNCWRKKDYEILKKIENKILRLEIHYCQGISAGAKSLHYKMLNKNPETHLPAQLVLDDDVCVLVCLHMQREDVIKLLDFDK
jgi:hypothetical protein